MVISEFPLTVKEGFLPKHLYDKIDKKYDIIVRGKTESFGQYNRLNKVVDESNFQDDSDIEELYNFLNSADMKSYLLHNIDLGSKIDKGKLLSDLNNSCLEINIAISHTGYENPWHVDSRKRVAHGLIYFRTDDYTGGELGVGIPQEYKKLSRYAEESELLETMFIPPSDNLGVVIFSTPWSYHKGCSLKGTRRFIYWSLNNTNIESWSKDESFDVEQSFDQYSFLQRFKGLLPLWMAGYYYKVKTCIKR